MAQAQQVMMELVSHSSVDSAAVSHHETAFPAIVISKEPQRWVTEAEFNVSDFMSETRILS